MPMMQGPDCGLWVEKLGKGDPVTIFSHGITSSIDELRPLASATPGTRIIFDLRGHGRSENPPIRAGYDHLAVRKDIEFIADTFNATRAFGISVSAGALLGLLCDKPDRFERVALFLTASIDEPNQAALSSFPALAAELETFSLEDLAERYACEQSDLLNARPYWKRLVRRRTLKMNAVGVPRSLRAYADGSPPIQDIAQLGKVTASVSILSHENDGIHDARHGRRLAETFPNATLRIWPDTLSMYDDLPAFARTIGEFFDPNF